ncbi:hypothetical protein ACHAXS_005148 [Conticribra weissflogii]
MMEYFCFTKMVTKFTAPSLFAYSACFANFQTIPNPSQSRNSPALPT